MPIGRLCPLLRVQAPYGFIETGALVNQEAQFPDPYCTCHKDLGRPYPSYVGRHNHERCERNVGIAAMITAVGAIITAASPLIIKLM